VDKMNRTNKWTNKLKNKWTNKCRRACGQNE
jgi:hypothetical protein